MTTAGYIVFMCFLRVCVGAAGPVVGAAADPSAEKLSGLHGGCRLVNLLPGTPPPVQGPVVSGLSVLLPNQRPHYWSSHQTSLHHRSAPPLLSCSYFCSSSLMFCLFSTLNFTFKYTGEWKTDSSMQKAGELAKEWCSGSGLHLVAVELILPKPFFSPTSSSQTSDYWNVILKTINSTEEK